MTNTAPTMNPITFLNELATRANAAGVFAGATVSPGRLECAALASAHPASYRVDLSATGEVTIALVTAARYLSQSIEADLVHTGDKLDDLLVDELIDQGFAGAQNAAIRVEHFRDEAKLFTFRSRLPAGLSTANVAKVLLAYEACFRQLGDMEADDEE